MPATRRPLSYDQVELALRSLVGERVSVRVVEPRQPERLVAVLEGVLGPATDEKAPSRFWPLEHGLGQRDRAAERSGILLHADAFGGAESRSGGHVLVIRQGGVLVNIRLL